MNMEKSKITTQIIAALAVSMALTSEGFHYGWSSPSLPKLLAEDSDIPITPDESSWIVSVFTLGSFFGLFVSGLLVDRYGRKLSLLMTMIPFLSSCILIGLAQSYWWLIVARFLAGLGTGMAYITAPMYLGEIADDRIRGALTAMIGFMLNAGMLLSYCVGPWVSRTVLAAVGGVLPLVFGLIFIWMPESPYFLVMKKKPDRAEKSLQWFRGKKNVTEELKKIQESVDRDQTNVGSISDLIMIPGNRTAMAIVIGLAMAQQLSGISAILAYSSQIFAASGSTLDSSISVIIIGVVQLFTVVLAIFTVDLAGRRPLLLFSAGGSIVFLGGEALYFQLQAMGNDVSTISWLPMTAIIGYMVCYTVGFGSLLHVVVSEVFPCDVKASAIVVSLGFGALTGMAVSKLYQVVADALGTHVAFWGFTVTTIFSGSCIFFLLPETKQRSLQSIQDELHKTTKPKTQSSNSVLA